MRPSHIRIFEIINKMITFENILIFSIINKDIINIKIIFKNECNWGYYKISIFQLITSAYAVEQIKNEMKALTRFNNENKMKIKAKDEHKCLLLKCITYSGALTISLTFWLS